MGGFYYCLEFIYIFDQYNILVEMYNLKFLIFCDMLFIVDIFNLGYECKNDFVW